MRILWVLAAVLGFSLADLPSCERATCSHCNVEFIARMCEKACSACPRTGTATRTGNRVHHEQARAPLPTTVPNTVRQDVQLNNIVRQAGVPTQTQQQFPVYNQALAQMPRPVQYAAPQTQAQPPILYPAGVSTLAPLIPPPRPIDIARNLAPADLAQPLPEYQPNPPQAVIPYSQPQTTQVQAPVQQHVQQQQFYSSPGTYQQQGTYQQPSTYQQPGTTDLFGRSLFSQPAQTPFHQTQSAQSNSLLNPFQPFLQQVLSTLNIG
ncbi:hypothetical protein OESDEN_16535 [Oesophagostomum dentatum]|uniref:Uncharacterized protein n=1 Tax=Oesophagostomum dentatum TaxID=61180 RepID=A0A0B1SJR1_OESDE|nr:hypothetical protein OESDEN_16535 [Oesophagostomum dentatum]